MSVGSVPRRTTAVRAVLGPWALLPTLTGIVIGLGAMVQGLALALISPVPVCPFACAEIPWFFAPGVTGADGAYHLPTIDVAGIALTGALCSLATWGVLTVFRRAMHLAPTAVPHRLGYLTALIATAAAAATMRVVMLTPIERGQTAYSVFSTSIRFFIVIAFVHSTIGLITDRHARAQARAESALETVRRQQALIVGADERARREVADFLHDRVQARLLVVAMQIQSATMDASGSSAERLYDAIQELEHIRNDDVRAAGRRLSPDLRAVGLDTAFAELASSWGAAMAIDVTMDAGARLLLQAPTAPLDILTALYRTVEQALLNSAAHGHADRVDVRITLDAAGPLHLTVRDDGIGFTTITPGSGSAVIDAWLDVVGGSWTIAHSAGTGTLLTATIPT